MAFTASFLCRLTISDSRRLPYKSAVSFLPLIMTCVDQSATVEIWKHDQPTHDEKLESWQLMMKLAHDEVGSSWWKVGKLAADLYGNMSIMGQIGLRVKTHIEDIHLIRVLLVENVFPISYRRQRTFAPITHWLFHPRCVDNNDKLWVRFW